jgi:hypothetical protein
MAPEARSDMGATNRTNRSRVDTTIGDGEFLLLSPTRKVSLWDSNGCRR